MKNLIRFNAVILIFLAVQIVAAQTTAFNYQGRLTDAGSPANGAYEVEFKLYDALAGGMQIGATVMRNVTAVNGIFNTSLDFGAAAFPGADRFLEISVRRNPGDPFTTLSPRQQINSSPYSTRTLSAVQADTAVDANKLGGVDAGEYVTNSSLSTNFVRNQTTLQANSNFNISGNGIVGGRIGIGTNNPGAALEVRGTGVHQRITDNASGNSLVLQGGAGNNMKVTGYNYNTFTAVPLYLSIDGANTILNSGGGNVGVGTTNPGTKLTVFSNFYGLAHTDGSATVGTFLNSQGGWFGTTSNHALHFFTNDGAPRATLATNGNFGIGTTNPTQKLDIVGTTRTGILQITGGSDLAENFEMAEMEVKPGMVVAIDPSNVGKLVLARGAYNRRVAGIVSGANNLSAGMVLPDLKEGTNALPVALSGRVWVYADATKNPIQPGDLLTTSDTAGFAMKVKDHKKAQGAIIGKAMTELKSGTGLVLVLVSLQ